jgi:hypothetical protein
MPNVKKAPQQKVSDYRRYITLTPPVAKRVERMADEEQRPVTTMLRILVERGLEQQPVGK